MRKIEKNLSKENEKQIETGERERDQIKRDIKRERDQIKTDITRERDHIKRDITRESFTDYQ